MPKIKIKNPKELKKSKKPIRIIGKVLTGIAIAGVAATLLSADSRLTVVQNEYYNARAEAQESGRPQEIALLTGDEKIEGISDYFSEAIMENDKINIKQKEIIIDGFEDMVIEKYGNFFTEETILNMYAVASTENCRNATSYEMGKRVGGAYDSYLNEIATMHNERDTFAHEQLHAISRIDCDTTGYYDKSGQGYGINEGMTCWLSDGRGYIKLAKYSKAIGSIIGYDKLIKNYFAGNLDGLIEELNKYLSEDESINLINSMDEFVMLYDYGEKIDETYDDETYFFKMKEDSLKEIEIDNKIKELLQKAKENAIKNEEFMSVDKLINDYLILGISNEEDFEELYRNRDIYIYKGIIKK